jgi:MbtH protein
MNIFDDPDTLFLVVRNDEEQYSIWPERLDLPAGWSRVRDATDRTSALEFIAEAWTDMRPASLRAAMAAAADDGAC